MRLSDNVEKSDIEEAVRLIRTAMQQSATDPKTGEIDMDIITTGVSATSTKRIKEICDFIKKITVSILLKASVNWFPFRLITEKISQSLDSNTLICLTS